MNKDPGAEWSPDDIMNMIANPVYTGIGPYERIVTDEQWIAAAKTSVKEHGLEDFLNRMLRSLRESMG